MRLTFIVAICVGALMDSASAQVPNAPDQMITSFLNDNPTLRLATIADCGDCASDIAEQRKGSLPEWPAVPNYEPYKVMADLNGDAIPDLALVLIDTTKTTAPFVLVIFNSVGRSHTSVPSYIERNLDLRSGGLFYGPPRPKPYRLVVGHFAAEGAMLVPKGKSYLWKED